MSEPLWKLSGRYVGVIVTVPYFNITEFFRGKKLEKSCKVSKSKKKKKKKKIIFSIAFKLSFCKTFFIKKIICLLGCVGFSCGTGVVLLQHIDFSLAVAPWAPQYWHTGLAATGHVRF